MRPGELNCLGVATYVCPAVPGTVIVAVPVFVPFWIDVAVTVMICVPMVCAGAMNSPPVLMLPAVHDQETD